MIPFGFELEAMLQGRKELAVFYKSIGEEFDETGGQDFDLYVQKNEILKSIFYIKSYRDVRIKYTMYYFERSIWRSELYKALKKSMFVSGWNQEKENIERQLLAELMTDATSNRS
jgi:hypothetical protein